MSHRIRITFEYDMDLLPSTSVEEAEEQVQVELAAWLKGDVAFQDLVDYPGDFDFAIKAELISAIPKAEATKGNEAKGNEAKGNE
jgi:hypothetical protein